MRFPYNRGMFVVRCHAYCVRRLLLVCTLLICAVLGSAQAYKLTSQFTFTSPGGFENPVVAIDGTTVFVAGESKATVGAASSTLRLIRKGAVAAENFDILTDLVNVTVLDMRVSPDHSLVTLVGRLNTADSQAFIGAFDTVTGATKYEKLTNGIGTFDFYSQVRYQGSTTVVCGVVGDLLKMLTFRTATGSNTVGRVFDGGPVRLSPRMEMSQGNAIVVYSGVSGGSPRMFMRSINVGFTSFEWGTAFGEPSDGLLVSPLPNGDIIFVGNTPDSLAQLPTQPVIVKMNGATGAPIDTFHVQLPPNDSALVQPQTLGVQGDLVVVNSKHTSFGVATTCTSITNTLSGQTFVDLDPTIAIPVESVVDGDGEQHLLRRSSGDSTFVMLRRTPDSLTLSAAQALVPKHLVVSVTRNLAVVAQTTVSGQFAVRLLLLDPAVIARPDNILMTTRSLKNGAPSLILGNDTAGIGSTVSLVTDVQHGTLTLGTDGSLDYVPDAGFFGLDSFTYRISRPGSTATAVVTIEVQPDLVGFVPDTFTTKGGVVLTTKLHLNGPRAVNNLVLSVGEDSVATSLFAPNATILVGQTDSNTISISTAPVRTQTVAHVLSGFNSNVVIAAVTIVPAQLQSVTAASNTVIGGALVNMTVTLDGKAPAGGFVVNLTDNSVALNRPASVTVPANQTSASFVASTAPVTVSALATVTAELNGVTKSTSVNVVGCSVIVSPSSIAGGSFGFGSVNITSNVAQSIIFTLSDNSSATNFGAPTVVVPSGLSTANFTVTTAPVAATQTSTITIAAQGVTRSTTVSVIPPSLKSLSVSPGSVQGGTAYAGSAELNGTAAANTTINLTSASPIVQVPGTVVVSSGSTFGIFPGTTSVVTSSTMVIITGTLNGVTKTTTLVVTP